MHCFEIFSGVGRLLCQILTSSELDFFADKQVADRALADQEARIYELRQELEMVGGHIPIWILYYEMPIDISFMSICYWAG